MSRGEVPQTSVLPSQGVVVEGKREDTAGARRAGGRERKMLGSGAAMYCEQNTMSEWLALGTAWSSNSSADSITLNDSTRITTLQSCTSIRKKTRNAGDVIHVRFLV